MSQQPATSLPEECWQNKGRAQPVLHGDELRRVPQWRDPVLKVTSWCGWWLFLYWYTGNLSVYMRKLTDRLTTSTSSVYGVVWGLLAAVLSGCLWAPVPLCSSCTSILLPVDWWGVWPLFHSLFCTPVPSLALPCSQFLPYLPLLFTYCSV